MLIKNFDKVRKQINESILTACNEIGITGTAQVQANAPVKTGNLRRSYGFKVNSGDKTYVVTFGTNVDYAVYVEMKPESRGGRPHFRRAIDGELEEFNKILAKHLGKVGGV